MPREVSWSDWLSSPCASAWSSTAGTVPLPTTPWAGGAPGAGAVGVGAVPVGGGGGASAPPVSPGLGAAVAIAAATSDGVTGGVPASCTKRVLPWENSSTGLAAADAGSTSTATMATTHDLPASTDDKR